MKALIARLFLLSPLLAAAVHAAQPPVHVVQAWSRATPPGAEVAAGYLTLHNTAGRPVKLTGASSPLATVEMHETRTENGLSRMRPVQEVTVPAGGTVKFEPGGHHFMLVGLRQPLKAGDRVPLTLRFEGEAPVEVHLEVQPLGSSAPAPARHQHH